MCGSATLYFSTVNAVLPVVPTIHVVGMWRMNQPDGAAVSLPTSQKALSYRHMLPTVSRINSYGVVSALGWLSSADSGPSRTRLRPSWASRS